MEAMAKWLTISALILVIAGAGAFAYRSMSFRTVVKNIEGQLSPSQMRFEIADTPAKQELGLGNRADIPDNYGMLFVFKKPDRFGFWMKDMLVPIDIIWLSDTGSIILIDHSVDPATYPHVFYPPIPVKYVLETRAGYASDHGWTVGTKVPLPPPYGS